MNPNVCKSSYPWMASWFANKDDRIDPEYTVNAMYTKAHEDRINIFELSLETNAVMSGQKVNKIYCKITARI